jgi:hypothetical protein
MAKEIVTKRVFSDDDKQAFAEKDLKIVRQSSLKCATDLAIHYGIKESEVLATIKVWAESLSDYVYNGLPCDAPVVEPPPKVAAPPVTQIPAEGSQPKPTASQGAIIATILTNYEVPDGYKVSMDRLIRAIWKKYGKYPTKPGSVNKIVAEIPVVNVIEEV